MSNNGEQRRPAPILAKRTATDGKLPVNSVRRETITSKRPLPEVPNSPGHDSPRQRPPQPPTTPPFSPPSHPQKMPPFSVPSGGSPGPRILMKGGSGAISTPPHQRPSVDGNNSRPLPQHGGEAHVRPIPQGNHGSPGPSHHGSPGPNHGNGNQIVNSGGGESQVRPFTQGHGNHGSPGPNHSSPAHGEPQGRPYSQQQGNSNTPNGPRVNKPSPPGTQRGIETIGRGDSGTLRGTDTNSPTHMRRITSVRNGVSLSTPVPLPPTSISPKRSTARDLTQIKNSKSLSNIPNIPPPLPSRVEKPLYDLNSVNKPPVPVRTSTMLQLGTSNGQQSPSTIPLANNKPIIPPKPAVLSEIEHTKLCEAFKKVSNSNKQLLAVTRVVKDSTSTKTVDIKALETECQDLGQFNTKFAQFVRDAAKELNHSKTCKVACLTIDITNLTIIICAALKVTANECESSNDSFFKQCVKAITTVRDSVFFCLDSLKEVREKIDASVIPQLEGHSKQINSILAGLVGSKVTGKLIATTTTLEVEAAVRVVVTSIFKLICSFNQPVLDQSIIMEAKVASCCISQLWATLTDESITTNTNLLFIPELREKIFNFASGVKSTFANFMEQTKKLVANPSKQAVKELQSHFQPIKTLLREIVAYFYVFSNNETTVLQQNNNITPSEKFYKIADDIISDPEPIVPPSPINETESVIDLPDNYVPEPDWLWDEPVGDDGRVLFSESGALRCATLNKLIIYITSNELSNLDSVKTFLTTYRSFTTPEVLLKKLVDRYHVPSDRSQADSKTIKLRCLNCLKQLILTQSENFSDSFIQQLRKLEEVDSSFASVVSTTLQKKQELSQKTTNEIVNLTVEEIIPLSAAKLLFVISEEEIARQLTLVDFRIYQAIKPEELLNLAWSKAKYKHRAKNVLTLIARSTALTKWVSSVILWQDNLRSRVRAFTKIINIAQHLRKLNNFNSLMAILAGVNTSAVYRLRYTREQLPENTKQILQEITDLMNPTSSYGNYRQALHDVNPPCIPFLGTYLTDITFIEDGNPDYIQGLINYRKRELVYSVIRDIQQYQQRGYPEALINIAYFLTELPSNDENSLYDLSLFEEPRGATLEQLL